MKKYLFCILLLTGLLSCTSNPKDTPKKGGVIKYKITGKVDFNDGQQVYLQNHDNQLQQFQKTTIQNGIFGLEGELASDGIYELIVRADKGEGIKPFKYVLPVFLENDCTYDFEVIRYKDKNIIQEATIKTNSQASNDLLAFNKAVEAKQAELKQKINSLSDEKNQLNELLLTLGRGQDEEYGRAVDRMHATQAESRALAALDPKIEASASFVVNPAHRASLMTPYLFRFITIREDNYAKYAAVLDSLEPVILQHPLTLAAREKVDRVKDFYENMPAFPNITPRNVQGDSLHLSGFNKDKMLIVALWSSKDRFSKMDIPELLRKEPQLKTLGVPVIYLSVEKQFEEWQKGSKTLGMGLNNYLLNVTDKDFIINNYNVTQFPAYLWVNPATLKVVNLKGADPANPDFMTTLKKELQKM
ncbi:DUF4369 domain-containing protein [Sphingobacterium spiritivorum]|uniref:DUF4369 domain-containing protein n=1 Tax=Sphingobacterium spiritivorum TaxID=258 RepID=UPI003DA6CC09